MHRQTFLRAAFHQSFRYGEEKIRMTPTRTLLYDVSNNFLSGDLPVISNQSALQRLHRLVKPTDFAGNAFLCPIPAALLPSNLTCVCGDGYTIKSTESTMKAAKVGNADENGMRKQIILAREADDLCVLCPEGSYSNTTTNQKCGQCPAGSTPGYTLNRRPDHCEFCLPGTFANDSTGSSCTPCNPGTYADVVGATSCNSCTPGHFATGQGSTNCTLCAVGTFSDRIGSITCTSCPPGTYVNAEGEAECLMCPKDEYQDEIGSVECKRCPVGHIAPQQGYVKCTPCSPGSFYDAKIKICLWCCPGTFSAVAAQTECGKCENGTVAEGFGEVECLSVAAPGSEYKTLAIATKCEPGTFNNGLWRTCQSCSPGTFASTTGSLGCSPCAKGSFASNKGSVSCEKAPPGWFVEFEGATRAEPCPPNHFAGVNGQITCTPCQSPSFSFLPGGVECSFAKPGEVYEYVEWPRLALNVVGFKLQNLPDTTNDSIDALTEVWAYMLTSYLDSTYRLHVLQVKQPSGLSQLTQILVAAEMIIVKTHEENKPEKRARDAFHQATETAKSALEDLLDELDGSISDQGKDESETDQLADLVQSNSFRDAMVRQFRRVNLFDGALPFSMMNMSMVEPPFNSTRAVACAPGTFFSVTSGMERVCLPCRVGSYSSISGALKCELCPHGTFAAKEGLEMCNTCPLGADATAGASSCVECSWFTYECEGFWGDLIAAVCLGAALLRKVYYKIRKLCVGDQAAQEQDASVALMIAIRTHGRTFDRVWYAPMVRISFG
ncbi:hypothetical protein PHMEG_00031323, partial [Phytophthora megakarya]